jgi:prephenate dehydrogenase
VALWAEIVSANPKSVAAALRGVVEPLERLIAVLDHASAHEAAAAVGELVRAGHHGRELMAGKHGQRAVRWATVAVVVPDEPGKLARLLADAASAKINVEDIRVDHSPGQPLGLVELDVEPAASGSLELALRDRGWTATASLPPPEDPG